MKIVHVLGNQYLPSHPDDEGAAGPARVALEIARAQAESGHTVSVVVADKNSWKSRWHSVLLMGVPISRWATVQVRGRVIDFQRHLPYVLLTHLNTFDIVHGHVYSYMRFLRARARVVHFHGDPTHRGSKNEGLHLKQADFRNIAQYSQAQIAVSEFVARELRRGFGESGNIHVVSNGVDATHFDSTRWQIAGQKIRQEHNIPAHAVVFLFAGAIVQEKGVLHLARAFVRLATTRTDVHLLLAGGSGLWGGAYANKTDHQEYEQQVGQILRPLAQAGQVHTLGKVVWSAMPGVYAASDVLVVPSICRESFSLVAAEAQSSSRPVICANYGGVVEIVTDKTGILLDPSDEHALETAMRTLVDHLDVRKQLGNNARQQALRFSWSTAAEKLDSIYQDILHGIHP
jgi:glycosyltransferase involved in cell wall biosynthesis